MQWHALSGMRFSNHDAMLLNFEFKMSSPKNVLKIVNKKEMGS